MHDKPVQVETGSADKAITHEPTLVYWIIIAPTALATAAKLNIRDGFSATDPVLAYIYSGQGTPFNFYPPIRCAHGLFIDVVSGLDYFSVGYLLERAAKGRDEHATK